MSDLPAFKNSEPNVREAFDLARADVLQGRLPSASVLWTLIEAGCCDDEQPPEAQSKCEQAAAYLAHLTTLKPGSLVAPSGAELEQARANLEGLLRAVRVKICAEGADSSKSTLDAIDELIDERDTHLVRAVHLRGELRAAYLALEQALDWAKCDHERAHKHGEKPGRVDECADNLAVPASVCGWRRRVEVLQEANTKRGDEVGY